MMANHLPLLRKTVPGTFDSITFGFLIAGWAKFLEKEKKRDKRRLSLVKYIMLYQRLCKGKHPE